MNYKSEPKGRKREYDKYDNNIKKRRGKKQNYRKNRKPPEREVK